MATPQTLNRRDFIGKSALGMGGLILSSVMVGSCRTEPDPGPGDPSQQGSFAHGIASFDPTASQVIIWTRVSPTASPAKVALTYQLATDAAFSRVVKTEAVDALADDDFTVSIDLSGLTANTRYYYRFGLTNTSILSVVGETKTLPQGAEATEVRLAICSCSNYPSGFFNVYGALAASDADVVLHLGDYIYEYGAGQYGSNATTSTLNRAHQPATEIVTLDDYRTRFRQYRSDPQLQLAHQKKPFICVWDDHEVVNNAYKDGAQNHQPNEGPFASRKANALKAYHEYIGVRTTVNERIYRSFTFGNILNLHMLDTRLIGRDKQLDYGSYLSNGQLKETDFRRDWLNPSRTILGSEQLAWLGQALSAGQAAWQVLGQQVLMAKMYLPAELASTLAQVQAESTQGTINPATLQRVQGQVLELVQLKNRVTNNDPTLTAQERARISNVLPYNLDAWDGYPTEREAVLTLAKGKKLIALAGDTHNAWSTDLTTTDGLVAGREIATPSVTSPGFEGIVGNNSTILSIFEQALTILIDDLNYANISKKGYAQVTFTTSRAVADWRYVEGITTQTVATTVGRSEAITA